MNNSTCISCMHESQHLNHPCVNHSTWTTYVSITAPKSATNLNQSTWINHLNKPQHLNQTPAWITAPEPAVCMNHSSWISHTHELQHLKVKQPYAWITAPESAICMNYSTCISHMHESLHLNQLHEDLSTVHWVKIKSRIPAMYNASPWMSVWEPLNHFFP